jgi:hypothetical protein
MSDQLGSPVTLIPAQPAMLVVGERRIPIEEWPLASSVEERRSVELARPRDDVLVVEPKKRAATSVIARSLFVFLGGALPGAIAAVWEVPWWLAILIGATVAALLILLIRYQLSRQRWIRFDRTTGQLLIERRLGLGHERRVERTYPLHAIQAIQLLYNGRHSITEPQGAGDRQTFDHREFFGYELNLVLDDPQARRLNLLSLSDWRWLRETGEHLAAFLNVPVIDKLHHGG